MNILFVTYGLPYPPHSGARMRDWNFIQQLATRNAIHLLCLLENPDEAASIAELETYCAAVEPIELNARSVFPLRSLARHVRAGRPLATYPFFDERLMERARELAATRRFDVVHIEHSFLSPYVQALPGGSDAHTILDLHNIGALQYHRMEQVARGARARCSLWLKARLMNNWEARAAERFQAVIATSEDEARWLRSANPRLDVTVIENGVDARTCQPLEETPDDNLLFVGTMGYPPNEDAMLWFCDEILSRVAGRVPDVVLTIAGRAPTAAVRKLGERRNVLVTGRVDCVQPYYRQAQIVIAPLRAGGGTRLKILEAMAYGRPVVSTTVGCEGLAVRDEENILIADSPVDFADQIIRLLGDRERGRALARQARTLVESRYDWSSLGGKLLALYEGL